MPSFSGSYRAQMEASSRAAQAEAEAAGSMSWGEINDMLGQADMLDAPFTPPPTAEEALGEWAAYLDMGGGEAAAAEEAAAGLAEAAGDRAAFALGAAGFLAFGAIELAAYGIGYALRPDGTQGTYNFDGSWTLNCGIVPPTTRWKIGFVPPPSGQINQTGACSSAFNFSANGPWGADIPLGSTLVQFVYYDPGKDWPNKSGVIWKRYTHPASPPAPAVPWYTGGTGINWRNVNGSGTRWGDLGAPPASQPDPMGGGSGDTDHPRNRPVRWRPGPQDWPNVPRHLPGPKSPEPPPPGGTSGGGGASGGYGPGVNPPPDPAVWWPSLEDGPPPYKVPAHSYSNSNDEWEVENDWHLLVPDYAIKILMDAGIYHKTHWFKSPKGLDDLYKILAKSIPNHPCVGLTGSARVQCVMQNLDRVSWKHFAGQVGREVAKVDEPGVVRTPLPDWNRRAKKAFKVVRAVHNSVQLGVKRSRVFSSRKGMF